MLPSSEAYESDGDTKTIVCVYVESSGHYERYARYLDNVCDDIELYLIGTDDELETIQKNYIKR